jgi:hypothetical protein
VELLFEDRVLAAVCASERLLARDYGAPCARDIAMRFHEIEAAASLAELRLLPHVGARELPGRPGLVRLNVLQSHCLILRPQANGGVTAKPRIDWEATVAVVLLEISRAAA